MKTNFTLLFLLFLSVANLTTAQNTEQIIVFINPNKAVLEKVDMEAYQELAEELDIPLVFKDINQGAPQGVTLTPSIFFQNYTGRSLYYGRYKNVSRLKNFIRTSRLAPQQNSDNFKKDILLWRNEKAIITAPLKVTNLSGSVPKNFDQSAFKKSVKEWIAAGMNQFHLIDKFNQSRTTRILYVDIHPYLDASNNLSIKSEIYSQFNCIKPIEQYMDTPLHIGKWKNRNKCLNETGQQIEQLLVNQVYNSKIGDAFEAIPENNLIKNWADLDLALPLRKQLSLNQNTADISIPKSWTVEAPKANEPIIMFSFLAPLDNYVGEVKALEGNLILNESGGLIGAQGNFKVQTKDVTMGADDFDNEVQNKMLQMLRFPYSSFTFEKVKCNNSPLAFGKKNDLEVVGTFNMLGIKIPLLVPASIEPILNKEGDVRLEINTTFQLPLYEKFKLDGPDGPDASSNTLQFYMKFYLKPI